jgi:hypothetical protein
VGEILRGFGLIHEGQLQAALGLQRTWGDPLGQALIGIGAIDEPTVVRALCLQRGLPSICLEEVFLQEGVLGLLSPATIRELQILPLVVQEQGYRDALFVATARPWELDTLDTVQASVGLPVVPVLAGDEDLQVAIARLVPLVS